MATPKKKSKPAIKTAKKRPKKVKSEKWVDIRVERDGLFWLDMPNNEALVFDRLAITPEGMYGEVIQSFKIPTPETRVAPVSGMLVKKGDLLARVNYNEVTAK